MTKSVILLILLASFTSLASQDQNYGLDATSTGRVGSVTAEPHNAYAALLNPSLLGLVDRPQLSFSTLIVRAQYASLGKVLVDSPSFRTVSGEKRQELGQIPLSPLTSWAVGFSYPTAFLNRRFALGGAFSGPFYRLRSFQASTPYDFHSLRYGNSDAQFKGTLSLGLPVWGNHLFAGAGLSLYITSAGAAAATLNADNPTARLAIDVGMNAAALAGLTGRWENTTLSLVYRQRIAPGFVQTLTGKIPIGGLDTLEQPVRFESTLYFEPALVETDLQQDFGWVKASVGASWQQWSSYRPAFLVATAKDAHGTIRSTRVPALRTRDTVNPRASVEVPLLSHRLFLGAGYQYRPTPIRELSGASNIVDCDTHVLGAHTRVHFKQSAVTPPLRLGLFAQWHAFNRRQIAKQSPELIGAPGYTLAGSVRVFGLSLQAEL